VRILFVISWLMLALLPAFIAQRKGRSFIVWYIFGVLAFIIALPAALIVGRVEPEEPPALEPPR
jgi:hypothetical protein